MEDLGWFIGMFLVVLIQDMHGTQTPAFSGENVRPSRANDTERMERLLVLWWFETLELKFTTETTPESRASCPTVCVFCVGSPDAIHERVSKLIARTGRLDDGG
jgi:hypothetical protein